MINLFFDMDGTLCDLYGRKNWLEDVEKERLDFSSLLPLIELNCFSELLEKLVNSGKVTIFINTWLPKNASVEYCEKVAAQKKEWVEKNLSNVKITDFFVRSYGYEKHRKIPQSKTMILFDDNEKIRQAWETPKQRKSIDTCNMLSTLEKLVNILCY